LESAEEPPQELPEEPLDESEELLRDAARASFGSYTGPSHFRRPFFSLMS